MVEWHVITGIVPPMDETAWQVAFNMYRQTPEFKHFNKNMTVREYKTIYLIEYTHRLFARLVGLIVLIPLMIFVIRGIIPLRHCAPYLGIGVLFVSQGFFGWYMVQSGLVVEPRVSPYLLTSHLMMALTLLTLCLWKGLQRNITPSFQRLRLENISEVSTPPNTLRKIQLFHLKWLSLGLSGVIIVQIAYGGLTAGLRAGYVSDTFPLMFGYLIPPGMFSVEQPWFLNLVETEMTVQFVHRWLAFVALGLAGLLNYFFRHKNVPDIIRVNTSVVITLISLQILIGIGVIQFHVPTSLALIHQTVGILVFLNVLFLNYHLHRLR